MTTGEICAKLKMFTHVYKSMDEMLIGRRQIAIKFLEENNALPLGNLDSYLYEDLIHFCGKVLDKQVWL